MTARWVVLWLGLMAATAQAHTPDLYCRQGMRELEAGRLETAAEEFAKARALDEKFVPAFVGLALVAVEKGNFDGAFDLLKTGQKYDREFVEVYVARSQVYRQAGQKDWEKKALKELKKAERYQPGDARIAYARGQVYRQAGKLEEAVAAFGLAARARGPVAEKAAQAQHDVQLVQQALPVVRRSGRAIVRQAVVSRADLALLFLDEFDLADWLKRYRPAAVDTRFKAVAPGVETAAAPEPPAPRDVVDHPDKHAILQAVAMDIPGLELYPDGLFGPARLVTRAEFARIMQGLLVVGLKDRDLATAYFGEASRFVDMRADHFAYNAAVLCIQRGLLLPEADGRFLPDAPVSGAEAILGIKKALGI